MKTLHTSRFAVMSLPWSLALSQQRLCAHSCFTRHRTYDGVFVAKSPHSCTHHHYRHHIIRAVLMDRLRSQGPTTCTR